MLACYCYLCASTTSFSAHWLVLRKLFTKNLEKASRLLGKEGRSLRQEGSWNTGVADIKAAMGVRPLQRFCTALL